VLDVAVFRYEPPDRLHRESAGAAAVYFGLAARAYFLDEGSVDPYLELGLGVGALGTSFDEESIADGESARFEETGAGPAVRIGGGVDFYLSRRLRFGPAIGYTQVSVDKIRRCRGGGEGDCVDLPKDEHGHLNAYGNIGVRLVVMLGDEV
jgi:hypothetical protein